MRNPQELTLSFLLYFFRYLLLYTFRTPRLASFIWDSEVSSSQSFQWTSQSSASFWRLLHQASFVCQSLPKGNSFLPQSPSSHPSKNLIRSVYELVFATTLRLLSYPRFRKGLQRYAFFLYLQIFSQLFLTFLQTFFALNVPWSLNRLYDTTLRQTHPNREKWTKINSPLGNSQRRYSRFHQPLSDCGCHAKDGAKDDG